VQRISTPDRIAQSLDYQSAEIYTTVRLESTQKENRPINNRSKMQTHRSARRWDGDAEIRLPEVQKNLGYA
jgi:hypothetical protein